MLYDCTHMATVGIIGLMVSGQLCDCGCGQVSVHCVSQDVSVLRSLHVDDSSSLWSPDRFHSVR